MMITLTNDFHDTSVTLRVTGSLSTHQVWRAKRLLCGTSGCTCSDDLGRRGPQEHDLYEVSPGKWVVAE